MDSCVIPVLHVGCFRLLHMYNMCIRCVSATHVFIHRVHLYYICETCLLQIYYMCYTPKTLHMYYMCITCNTHVAYFVVHTVPSVGTPIREVDRLYPLLSPSKGSR